jgi:hypothetical protein
MLDKIEVDIKALMEVDTECVPPSLCDEEELLMELKQVMSSALYDLLPEGSIVELDITIEGL